MNRLDRVAFAKMVNEMSGFVKLSSPMRFALSIIKDESLIKKRASC